MNWIENGLELKYLINYVNRVLVLFNIIVIILKASGQHGFIWNILSIRHFAQSAGGIEYTDYFLIET